MKWLLQGKEAVKGFYEKYDRYVNCVCRFFFATATFLTVFYFTGYNAKLNPVVFSLIGALVCAFLPASFTSVLMCILIIVEFLSVSVEVALVSVILILLMLLLYFVFRGGKSELIALTVAACCLKLPAALLPAALLISPAEVIVVLFGVVIYAMVLVVKKDFSVLSSSEILTLGGRVNLLMSDILTNERFLLVISCLAVSMLLISILSRSRINYAPTVAVISGDFLYLVLVLLGNFFIEVDVDYLTVIAALLINALLSFLIITLVIHADYRHTEQVRFEDDEYYYFVKAVPKTSVAVTEKKVESITSPVGRAAFDEAEDYERGPELFRKSGGKTGEDRIN